VVADGAATALPSGASIAPSRSRRDCARRASSKAWAYSTMIVPTLSPARSAVSRMSQPAAISAETWVWRSEWQVAGGMTHRSPTL
jgi:hypothetical protein